MFASQRGLAESISVSRSRRCYGDAKTARRRRRRPPMLLQAAAHNVTTESRLIGDYASSSNRVYDPWLTAHRSIPTISRIMTIQQDRSISAETAKTFVISQVIKSRCIFNVSSKVLANVLQTSVVTCCGGNTNQQVYQLKIFN